MIKLILPVLLAAFLWCCSTDHEQPSLTDPIGEARKLASRTLSIEKPVLVFVISPGDCITCYISFQHALSDLKEMNFPPGNIILVLPDKREVEKKKILDELLSDYTAGTILWNDSIFNAFLRELGPKPQSSLLVYEQGDKPAVIKPLKEISTIKMFLKIE